MRRSIVLGTLMAAGALSLAVSAYQAPPSPPAPKVVEVEKIKDNLYMLKGGGGNTAVFVGTTGVVVVDTKLPGWGQPILDKVKELTPKPVTTIINTHTHGDHVSGNVEFPATVDIVTQENTKANMEKMATPTGIPAGTMPNVFQASGGKGMPKRTFKDTMTLDKGADRIDLYYFGRGHTNGDAFVVFPALRVMHAGDIFARKGPPLLDANNGGSGVAIGDTLAKAGAGIKAVDSVITGHSTLMTWADLQEYARYNQDFLEWVRAEMKAGKTVEAAAAEYKIPEKYAGYTDNPERVKLNVGVIYDELKK
ncbi:MAG TPA: MBL fold metallo-hydrolase [Vicinamibacteria bacterium]|nr:MBL fold metallo-hydrolase [Vicinamibacteria bacterium]